MNELILFQWPLLIYKLVHFVVMHGDWEAKDFEDALTDIFQSSTQSREDTGS